MQRSRGPGWDALEGIGGSRGFQNGLPKRLPVVGKAVWGIGLAVRKRFFDLWDHTEGQGGGGAKRTNPRAQQATVPRHTSCGEERVTVTGPGRKTMQDDPRSTSRSRSRPSTGPHAHTREATRAGAMAEQTTTTLRTLRRAEWVTVQGRRAKCHTGGFPFSPDLC